MGSIATPIYIRPDSQVAGWSACGLQMRNFEAAPYWTSHQSNQSQSNKGDREQHSVIASCGPHNRIIPPLKTLQNEFLKNPIGSWPPGMTDIYQCLS